MDQMLLPGPHMIGRGHMLALHLWSGSLPARQSSQARAMLCLHWELREFGSPRSGLGLFNFPLHVYQMIPKHQQVDRLESGRT